MNVGAMTGKGRALVIMMQRRKVDGLCPGDQVERQQGWTLRSSLFYHGGGEEKCRSYLKGGLC